jgi:N-methylhydantoinase B
VIEQDLLDLFLANVRVPEERKADLFAQLAASRAGVRRLKAMMQEHGATELLARARDLVAWTASLTSERLATLKPGTWRFEDVLEGGADGLGELLPLRLAITSGGQRLQFDFRDSALQAHDGAPVNTTRAVTVSAVFYVLRLLLPEGTPTNAGVLDGVEIQTTPGTIVDASYPAAVAAGNVETSQRLVDVILGALARMLPDEIPAASAGQGLMQSRRT